MRFWGFEAGRLITARIVASELANNEEVKIIGMQSDHHRNNLGI
jgi:hypothetical protein